MVRELSAGGVVVRRMAGSWWIAVIEPYHREDPPAQSMTNRVRKVTLCLPKGALDPGEKPQKQRSGGLRRDRSHCKVVTKLADSKYAYVRNWATGPAYSKS